MTSTSSPPAVALVLLAAVAALGGCGRSADRATPTSTSTTVDMGLVGGGMDLPTTTVPSVGVPTTLVAPTLELPEYEAVLDLVSCDVEITLPNESLQFAVDSAEIPAGPGRDLLVDLAGQLAGAPEVTIVGHTSSEGAHDHNVDLSVRRAQSTADVIAPLLSGTELVVRGVGPDEPSVPEDGTEATRAPNRRVVISGQVTAETCTSARTGQTVPAP